MTKALQVLSLYNCISKIFPVFHDHVSHYFKLHFNPYRSRIFISHTDFQYFIFLEFVSLLFNSQREIQNIYFYFRNAYDLVPHTHTYCSFANLLRAMYLVNKLVSYLLHQPFKHEAQTALFKDPVRTAQSVIKINQFML